MRCTRGGDVCSESGIQRLPEWVLQQQCEHVDRLFTVTRMPGLPSWVPDWGDAQDQKELKVQAEVCMRNIHSVFSGDTFWQTILSQSVTEFPGGLCTTWIWYDKLSDDANFTSCGCLETGGYHILRCHSGKLLELFGDGRSSSAAANRWRIRQYSRDKKRSLDVFWIPKFNR